MKEEFINAFINYSREISRTKTELDYYKSIDSNNYKDYVLNLWMKEPEIEIFERISTGLEIIERSKLNFDNADYVFNFENAAQLDCMLNELIKLEEDYMEYLLNSLSDELQKCFNN